jgi:acetyl-CoA C-acetyltransferase
MSNTAYIVDALRSPIGKFGGTLSSVRPDDLAAHLIKALLARHPDFDLNEIEDVVLGAANQSGEDNRNVARMAGLLAGLPITSGGVTVNRLCASGLQAIMDASRAIALGEGNAYIAGGVESMSRAPFVMPKATEAFSRNAEIYDTTLGWRFINKKMDAMYGTISMGETAENVAIEWNISREAQDQFALSSQEKYAAAHTAGKFNEELISIEVKQGKETITFSKDEHPRATSLDKLATLKSAFREGGSVTAGNSSGLNDGAAAILMVNEETLKKYNFTPLARVASVAVAGVSPHIMGVGPIPASRKAMQRAGINSKDLGLVELNEAFASQSLACVRDLELDPSIVNVNGGAIALGHPLGCSGARITTTLLYEMRRRNVRYGLATMCIGVGQGAAIIYEKL